MLCWYIVLTQMETWSLWSILICNIPPTSILSADGTDVIPSAYLAQPSKGLTDVTGALVNWTPGKRRHKAHTQVKCT